MDHAENPYSAFHVAVKDDVVSHCVTLISGLDFVTHPANARLNRDRLKLFLEESEHPARRGDAVSRDVEKNVAQISFRVSRNTDTGHLFGSALVSEPSHAFSFHVFKQIL